MCKSHKETYYPFSEKKSELGYEGEKTALTWLQADIAGEGVGEGGAGVVPQPPHDGSVLWLVLG